MLTAYGKPAIFANNGGKKKNVIWILADDLGYGDVGSYGCRDISTPNIDRLAQDGAMFTRSYAYPACTPTRAALLTGRYPEKAGITGVLMGKGGMDSSATTIAEVFKKSGYTTACIGKWHLGYAGDTLPNSQGFDFFYGHRGGKIDYFKHTDTAQKLKNDPNGKHDLYKNQTEIFEENKYSTNLFTNSALNFIKENSSKPFFMYLAYNAPHYSRHKELQAPGISHHQVGQSSTREVYAAMVECMDEGIGQIIKMLESAGLADDTIICFISDNGADPVHGGSNGLLREKKGTCWEGGIRTPLIIKWPGLSTNGTKINCPIGIYDLFPTFVKKLGLKYDIKNLDGVDISGIFKSDNVLARRNIYLRFASQGAVIDGKWKMMKDKDQRFLFDLENDFREQHDLANEHPAVLDKMYNSYLGWEKTLIKPLKKRSM
ncbi:MAG: hypothetical protein A2Y10_03745 [Planctomycetes bacterium GWF2_41_51]|nr:MAG: hypothetical protein A2Y10_03745 [Planctomycetes bacterium GWF2_41_51]